MSGGQAAVASLQVENVEHVFGLIGSATMEMFDALYDANEINFIGVHDERTGTHLYAPGLCRHIPNALKAGATMEEILDTIQLTTVMGIHFCNLAPPILMEEVSKFKE